MPCLYSCTLITQNLQNHNHQKWIKDNRYFPLKLKVIQNPPWIPFISNAGVSKCRSLTLHLNPCLYWGIDNRSKVYHSQFQSYRQLLLYKRQRYNIWDLKLFSFSMDFCVFLVLHYKSEIIHVHICLRYFQNAIVISFKNYTYQNCFLASK